MLGLILRGSIRSLARSAPTLAPSLVAAGAKTNAVAAPLMAWNPAVLNTVRFMNRNARLPKKANHGKRPCCNARRKAKAKNIKSVAARKKMFGFF